MDLEFLSKMEQKFKTFFADVILFDEDYKNDIEKGLRFFKWTDLEKIEKDEKYKDGLTFQQIDEILSRKGMIFKLPTFKKYVAMKLIPDSIKIEKTKRGIISIYPVSVIKSINFIKYVLYKKPDLRVVAGKFLKRNRKSALEIIESQFSPGLGPMEIIMGDNGGSGVDLRDLILETTSKLVENKEIEESLQDKILNLVDELERTIPGAIEKFYDPLIAILGDIKVPSKIARELLGLPVNSESKP